MNLVKFQPFDPLDKDNLKSNAEVELKAVRNSIKGILTSYVGWYDPFAETIQNAMDSVEKRLGNGELFYKPKIWITIDQKENILKVTDNGVGLDEERFKSFIPPFYSFKNEKNRGHKGVGATYLAYGFNYIQLCTKTSNFTAIGKMEDARNWVEDEDGTVSRPQVIFDSNGALDPFFKEEILDHYSEFPDEIIQ